MIMFKEVFFVISFGLISVSQGCFPSKYWISCRIDTCKLGGSCPGDPTATCRMDTTECNGCRATWYTASGEKANCSAVRNLELCPGGEPIVHCKMDPCQWSCDHPKYRNAPCRKNYCGRCEAEYLIEGQWGRCPATMPSKAGSMLPIDTVVNPETVVGDCQMVPCSIKVCIGHKCGAVPNAVCRPYSCNGCAPMWYLDNIPVDCNTGDFIKGLPKQGKPLPLVTPIDGNVFPVQRACKPGQSYVQCPQSVCDGQTCRNHPNAVCRADGCGKCKATWYVDNKLVDCLSDQCAPNVPVVKCVDDPCKYFSHYCPTAECRASQCGTCEAKFYVDGNEIDCVMPPKVCPLGTNPLSCPFFTCPANICPSNTRLMCRIDPCGNNCRHEWVDVYNGEVRSCRTFDGGKPKKGKSKYKKPEMTKIFFRDPIHAILDPNPTIEPIYVDKNEVESKYRVKEVTATGVPPENQPSLNGLTPMGEMGEFVQKEQGGFKVQPLFINPGPQIQDTDVLALLRSFNHEFERISSATIRNALKKPIPKLGPQSNMASPPMSQSALKPLPSSNFIPMNQAPIPLPVQNKEFRPTLKKAPKSIINVPNNMDSGSVKVKGPIAMGGAPTKPIRSQFMPGQSQVLPIESQSISADGQIFPPGNPALPIDSAQMPVDVLQGQGGSGPQGAVGQGQTPLDNIPVQTLPNLPIDSAQIPVDILPDQGNLLPRLTPGQPNAFDNIPVETVPNQPIDSANIPVDILPDQGNLLPIGSKAGPSKAIELKHNSPVPDTLNLAVQDTFTPSKNTLDQAAALLAQLNKQGLGSNIDLAQLIAAAGAAQAQVQPAVEPLYPEINLIDGASPSNQQQGQNQQTQDIVPVDTKSPKLTKSSPKQNPVPVTGNNGGLPISMTLFDQWG